MSHTMRINQNLWDLIQDEAQKRLTKPSRLVDLAVRRELGLEPGGTVQRKEVLHEAADDDSWEENGEELGYSPLVGNVAEIRHWQKLLEQAQSEYEGYKNGVSEEDWALEQRSDYVVDCLKRIEEAKLELHALVPATEGE